jgi:flagellar hook capping protein FlgD
MRQKMIILVFILSFSFLSAELLNIYTSQQNYEFDLTEIINLSFSDESLQVETFEVIHTFMYDEILYMDFDTTPTGTDQSEIPSKFNFLLRQNYPNPFNPDTNISFALEEAGKVEIAIFNAKGQNIRTLVNGNYTAGEHVINWNGRSDQQKAMPSGVYYYRMNSNAQYINKKMILLK